MLATAFAHNKPLETTNLVQELQQERRAVWMLYCQLAQLKPFANSIQLGLVLTQFSQLLIDYISLGHFGVYEQLLAQKQHQKSALSLANALYPLFSSTTASAVFFNDRYENGLRKFNIDHLADDLSKLGESLAQRMELEDTLCGMLLD